MQRLSLLLSLILCLLASTVWLAWNASRQKAAFLAEQQQWSERTGVLEGRLQSAESEAALTATQLSRLEEESQGHLDRATNLGAQRDHLQVQLERLQMELTLHGQNARKRQAEIESLRLEVIRLGREPAQLQAERQHLARQVTELEEALDRATSASAHLPTPFELQGLSADQRVFSLTGALAEDLHLPREVLLCKGRTIVAEGWLNRVENGLLLGHVKDWRVDASELVKGTKVFIVSSQYPRTLNLETGK